jgi:hypothetical protein
MAAPDLSIVIGTAPPRDWTVAVLEAGQPYDFTNRTAIGRFTSLLDQSTCHIQAVITAPATGTVAIPQALFTLTTEGDVAFELAVYDAMGTLIDLFHGEWRVPLIAPETT